ncbi:hypothetical protein JZ751_011887 [Albula glossodonta]|uniref:Uncharacterized protein n=1 Tax=Albula glossodonta TaxID=121402 RepID=A0A8T2PQZ2_9TELE|nr:hypothetical protein JZ751_011887 [Albula glossodonta]
MTARLLTDPGVSRSRQLVLYNGNTSSENDPELRDKVLRSRPGNRRHPDGMLPGYTGFTGFVPKARFLFGSSFPTITNKALVQFDKEQRAKSSSVDLGDEEGYKFRYGQPFGQLTHDALGSKGA